MAVFVSVHAIHGYLKKRSPRGRPRFCVWRGKCVRSENRANVVQIRLCLLYCSLWLRRSGTLGYPFFFNGDKNTVLMAPNFE